MNWQMINLMVWLWAMILTAVWLCHITQTDLAAILAPILEPHPSESALFDPIGGDYE